MGELSAKGIINKLLASKSVKYSQRYRIHYGMVNAKLGTRQVRLFFCRRSKSEWWRILLTTDTTIDFMRAYEIYAMRWAIEVFFADSKRLLGMADCSARDYTSAAGIAVVDDSGAPTIWAPYSGDQMLAAFADADGQNDDWLISPELPGTAQTLSFYLKSVTGDYGLETYEIQISSTNKDLASFQNVSDASVIKEAPLEWTNVTVDLPEETKYFAIRCTSPDRFALLVDDITYIPTSAVPVELSLVGYNVYRDDSKITDEPITATTYTDAVPESGEYKYKVTTVYDKGESVYSNEVTVNVVGVSINNVYAEGAGVRGVRHAIDIRDAVDIDIYIYTIQGKLVYKGAGESVSKVPVADGEYIVKAGDKAVKVVVK